MTKINRVITQGLSTLTASLWLTNPAIAAVSTPTPAANTLPVAPVAAPTPVFTSSQEKAIGQIVKSYLLENPEVLLQVSAKLREKMQQQQAQQAMDAIETNKTALFDNPKAPTFGNANGTKILVEFFDYQCPHCKSMGKIISNLVTTNPNLKVIYLDLPIFGGASDLAAKASLAAQMQGKYLQLHDALLAADNPLSEEKIMALAKAQGLNMAKLKKDMDNPSIQAQLDAARDLAEKLSLQGTPAFVLTNTNQKVFKFLPGETSEQNLQALLNQL